MNLGGLNNQQNQWNKAPVNNQMSIVNDGILTIDCDFKFQEALSDSDASFLFNDWKRFQRASFYRRLF